MELELKIKKLELDILKELDFEMFLPIENYGNYCVSNFGNVKNNKTNRIMKLRNHRHGYKFVSLYKNGKCKMFYIHRLVAYAFIENPDNKPKVDHIDENKANNNVKNLRWATVQENKYNQGKNKTNTRCFKGVSFDKNAKRKK